MELERELHVPVNVINATGGKGVTGHHRGLTARPDGYTLTMMTFELNTMHWIGLTDLDFRSCVPLVSVNEDYAAIFVANNSPWETLEDLHADIKARPGELTASGTAAGGAWHLALAGWLLDSGLNADDVLWIPSPGANPSLQELMSGGVDLVCCSLPEALSLLDAGEVRSLGVMSPKRAVGFEQVPTFAEQGSTWTLGGWRGLGVPLETPSDVVEHLQATLHDIVGRDGPDSFQEFMRAQKFDATIRDADNFAVFLGEGDEKLGKLLQSEAMQSVTRDRFDPMMYPYLLFAMLGISALAIAWQSLGNAASRREYAQRNEGNESDPAVESSGLVICGVGFALVLLLIGAYALFAEQVGFLILAPVIMLVLMLWLRVRLTLAVPVVLVFVPVLYLLFSSALRVPLPEGWLG